MRATLIYGAGDLRIEDVPDPELIAPTDAIVRVVNSCICGSDLWPYGSTETSDHGSRIGHEFLGVVEETGSDVSGVRTGDLVVAPFVISDNTCELCQEGLHTSCRHGGMWGAADVDGGPVDGSQGAGHAVTRTAGKFVHITGAIALRLDPA